MKPEIIFSDFDGTLTHGVELGLPFFSILELLKKQNLPLIVVTGRSIQWIYFLLSHFPQMNLGIAEGGGVFAEIDHKTRLIKTEYLVSDEELLQLSELTAELLKRFPELELSADSSGRRADRAIEKRVLEDPKVLKDVRAFLDESGIHHSESNVHLNYWVGDVSKAKAIKHVMKKYYPKVSEDDVLYFGDSLNDESVFKELPHTVGVSDINQILDKFQNKPSLILKGEENRGPLGVHAHLQSLFQ